MEKHRLKTNTDFWEIVDALLEREIIITTVYSNGFLVNDDFLKKTLFLHPICGAERLNRESGENPVQFPLL